jgi:cupin 2 domain-containing protein
MRPGTLFANLPAKGPEETIEILASGASARIERIVSQGHSSPRGFWYDQVQNELVVVLRGRARLELEGEPEIVEMGPGDYLDIPAHSRHRVAWTDEAEPTVWLAVHYD